MLRKFKNYVVQVRHNLLNFALPRSCFDEISVRVMDNMKQEQCCIHLYCTAKHASNLLPVFWMTGLFIT